MVEMGEQERNGLVFERSQKKVYTLDVSVVVVNLFHRLGVMR